MSELVLTALAASSPKTVDEYKEELSVGGGDLEIKSRIAVFAISRVETLLGVRGLASVDELDRETLTSVESLTRLLLRRWLEHQEDRS